jgi:hypothetical protein
MISGGAALTVGIWYQTLGAFAALISPWKFNGGLGNADGESTALCDNAQLKLFLEYFDMDAALRSRGGMEFFQFKVTSQQSPVGFTPEEVRDILRNATKAILEHESNSQDPVNGFTVATDRPIGRFAFLEGALNGFSKAPSEPDFFSAFAALDASSELFPNNPKDEADSTASGADDDTHDGSMPTKTMRQLAKSITWGYAKGWNSTPAKCVDACLRAMALFRFAVAHPTKLIEELERWLYTWGVLPTECNDYVSSIIGTLLTQSIDGRTNDELSIMRKLFSSPTAVPITARYIWSGIVDELTTRIWQEPTTCPIRSKGVESWIMDRSSYLNGLPYYSFSGRIDDIQVDRDPDTPLTVRPARIFVIVGPGGSGKSILMAQLFAAVGTSVWDWEAKEIKSDPKFLGCPIVQAAEAQALNGIPTSMMRWGKRRAAVEQTVERIAFANGIDDRSPAIWFGIDGMDELPIDQLRPLSNALANYAANHPGIRIVVTSRPEQFLAVKDELNVNGMLQEVRIEEFTGDEPIQAVLQATEHKLRTDVRVAGRSEVGSREPAGELGDTFIESSTFEKSIRQPLFVGVIRRLYEEGRLNLIQSAYEGDEASLKTLASEYMYTFCERAQRRLANPYITAHRVFRALKKLSIDGKNPTTRNAGLWKMICETVLDDHVSWNVLYTQCISSGLIKGPGAGAFEWRHPMVGEYLPDMQERPGWQ